MIHMHLPVVAIICHGELRADEHNLAVQQKHPAVETHAPAATQARLRKQSLDVAFWCIFCKCLVTCLSTLLLLVLSFVVTLGFLLVLSWCLQTWAIV